MPRRLAADARRAVRRAEAEARAEGARSIEAEHLLLALSADKETGAAKVLARAGLDHQLIRDALDREFREALRAAAVELADEPLPPRIPAVGGRLRMGQSAKLAWQRTVRFAAGRADKRLDTCHLLVGLLRAEHGRLPRALAQADVDRRELAASAETALQQEARDP